MKKINRQNRRNNRGVSDVLSFIVLIASTLLASSIVLTAVVTFPAQIQESVTDANIEPSLDIINEKIQQLTDRSIRSNNVNLELGGNQILSTLEGNMTIEYNGTSRSFQTDIMQIDGESETGLLMFGSVISIYDSGSGVHRSDMSYYTTEGRFVLNIYELTDNSSSAIADYRSNIELTDSEVILNRVDNSSTPLTVTVGSPTTDIYESWKNYFNGQNVFNVVNTNRNNREVTVEVSKEEMSVIEYEVELNDE